MLALKHDTIRPYGHTNATKREEVEHMFDNIAHRYDFLNHLLSAGIDHTWRKKAVDYIGQIQPRIIADLATGTGDFAMESARLHPTKIIGIDISEEMMHYGRIKAKNKGYSNIEFVKGDSEKLNFTSDYFDAMTVGFGVRNYQNLEQGLSEMYRVLKPNGKGLIVVWAMEQGDRSKFHFTKTDEFVEWRSHTGKVYNRYYHIYREGDLKEEVSRLKPQFIIGDIGWEKGNYYTVLTK
jgi:ubiquinone/menaquinone biosynthesis methyltransferase